MIGQRIQEGIQILSNQRHFRSREPIPWKGHLFDCLDAVDSEVTEDCPLDKLEKMRDLLTEMRDEVHERRVTGWFCTTLFLERRQRKKINKEDRIRNVLDHVNDLITVRQQRVAAIVPQNLQPQIVEAPQENREVELEQEEAVIVGNEETQSLEIIDAVVEKAVEKFLPNCSFEEVELLKSGSRDSELSKHLEIVGDSFILLCNCPIDFDVPEKPVYIRGFDSNQVFEKERLLELVRQGKEKSLNPVNRQPFGKEDLIRVDLNSLREQMKVRLEMYKVRMISYVEKLALDRLQEQQEKADLEEQQVKPFPSFDVDFIRDYSEKHSDGVDNEGEIKFNDIITNIFREICSLLDEEIRSQEEVEHLRGEVTKVLEVLEPSGSREMQSLRGYLESTSEQCGLLKRL